MKKLGLLGLGSRLSRVSELIMKEVQTLYKNNSIQFDPYHFPVFKAIVDGYETTTDITNVLEISQPGVTQFIQKLVDRNLIYQEADLKDKRKKVIGLTEKGKALHVQIKPMWDAIDRHLKAFTGPNHSFPKHLENLEEHIRSGAFTSGVQNLYNTLKSGVEITGYEAEYAPSFKALNLEWLKQYFVVEPHDEEVLSKPEHYIINKGGTIFFAKINDRIVGTVALMPTDEGIELSKMAVSPDHQGLHIGHKLMERCISHAKSQKWDRLLLYSNGRLKPAIHLYEKFGFKFLPIEESPYLRSDIKMELIIGT